MSSSLSSLTDNLAEDLHEGKCMDCKSRFAYMTVNAHIPSFRRLDCSKTYERKFTGDLFKRFQVSYKYPTNSVREVLTFVVSYCANLFIHFSTWMVGKDSMKLHY